MPIFDMNYVKDVYLVIIFHVNSGLWGVLVAKKRFGPPFALSSVVVMVMVFVVVNQTPLPLPSSSGK